MSEMKAALLSPPGNAAYRAAIGGAANPTAPVSPDHFG